MYTLYEAFILSYKQLLFSFCIDQKRFLYSGEEISLIIYQHIQLSLDLFIMKKRRNIMGSSVSAWSRIIGFVLSTTIYGLSGRHNGGT